MKFNVDCRRCGGHPGFDEQGREYTCYSCYNKGYITIEETYSERKTRTLNEAYAEYAAVMRVK